MKMINENRISPSIQQGENVEPKRVDVEVVEENHLSVNMDDFQQMFSATFAGLVGNTHSIYNGMSSRTLNTIDTVNASASFDVDDPQNVNIHITIKHK